MDQIPRGVYRRKAGRWQALIRHPVTKARICLGTFATAEEAKEAHDSKRREFDSLFPGHKKRNQAKPGAEQYRNNRRLCHVYATKSGRWTTEIGHPITKARVRLGTFDTAEEAKEAYDSKQREFDLMFPSNKKLKESNVSCKGDAVAEGKSDSACISDDPSVSNRVHSGTFTEEPDKAYDSKRHEFEEAVQVLMFPGNKKLKQSNESCRGDSACVSDDPSASSSGSMLNANVESVPMLVTEGRGEFDSDVIDSYGQLVGEYSSLDDELWLCRPEDG